MFTVTIHRFQPKKGKHRNQTFQLSSPGMDGNDHFPPTMMLAFGDSDKNRTPYDMVARNHAVTRIEVIADRNEIHIFTAPTTIRPYTEKLAKPEGWGSEVTNQLYAPRGGTNRGTNSPDFAVEAPLTGDELDGLDWDDLPCAKAE